MKSLFLALLLTTLSAGAMSQKPKVTVRFHAEANPNDGGAFAMPVKLAYAQREATLATVPVLSEREITAIFPFKTDDGTWGCVFDFNAQGRIRLETVSSQQLHTALVLFIGTKGGRHQVVDMLIDRPVTNGRITVPRGMTDLEVSVLKQQFKVLGTETPKEKKAREKAEAKRKAEETKIEQPPNAAQRPVAPANRPARNELRDLDQPRLED